jgi:predicted ArsR family transcriptional regulator
MKSIQLDFDGNVFVHKAKPRAGCIGKVQRLIDERPWSTCSEIAKAVDEPAARVSNALNKLGHEGHAQQWKQPGQPNTRWAGTLEAGSRQRGERMLELLSIFGEDQARKTAERFGRAFRRRDSQVQQFDS